MTSSKQGGIKDVAEGRSDIYRLDPRIIGVKPNWNCRNTDTDDYRAGIEELSRSVAEVGVKEAMTVVWENGTAWLTNGHRRLAATLKAIENGADIKTVPVQTESRFADEAERVLSMLVRNSGVPFTPFENAAVYKRLVDLGWTLAQIAAKTGLSDTRIRQTLDLLSMPEEVKAHVNAGNISPTMAATVVSKVGKGKADAVIKRGVEKAKAKGRKKTTAKDMIADLVGDADPVMVKGRKVIGHARTVPIGDDPSDLYNALKLKSVDLSPYHERLRTVLGDADYGDDLIVGVPMSRKLYDELCAVLGVEKPERVN